MRYRYDGFRDGKLKTVEIIGDENPLRTHHYTEDDLLPVYVAYKETGLQHCAHWARWNAKRKRDSALRTDRGTPLVVRLQKRNGG
ncbi:hypothetical protein [Geotalea sp. SG265]|uniref:hypothetical protein n=1 Tax=Geotalea sp. SG265 TaxID=2922867 RepID=UPI001FAF9A07|nr:hypothetical protein [Geotalea sp. SG265]